MKKELGEGEGLVNGEGAGGGGRMWSNCPVRAPSRKSCSVGDWVSCMLDNWGPTT